MKMADKRGKHLYVWLISFINGYFKFRIFRLFMCILTLAVIIRFYNFHRHKRSYSEATIKHQTHVSMETQLRIFADEKHSFINRSSTLGHLNTPIINSQDLKEYYWRNLETKINFSYNFNLFNNLYIQKDSNFATYLQVTKGTPTNATIQIARITLRYKTFNRTMPHFVSHKDRDLFLRLKENLDQFAAIPLERLTGDMAILYRGNVNLQMDCGWRNSLLDYYQGRNPRKLLARYRPMRIRASDIVVPLLVPDGWSFQHFMDGIMPKLAQLAPMLSNSNVKLMLQRPADRIITEILEHLGINSSRVIQYTEGVTLFGNQLNSCICPPMHPLLWVKMRELLGVNRHLKVTL